MNLTGQTAIVTGAGGPGCGRAIARRFAREGASVVVNDIDESGALHTRSLIEAEGGRAAAFLANVALEAEVCALIAFAEATFGGLDVVVNNASDLATIRKCRSITGSIPSKPTCSAPST